MVVVTAYQTVTLTWTIMYMLMDLMDCAGVLGWGIMAVRG